MGPANGKSKLHALRSLEWLLRSAVFLPAMDADGRAGAGTQLERRKRRRCELSGIAEEQVVATRAVQDTHELDALGGFAVEADVVLNGKSSDGVIEFGVKATVTGRRGEQGNLVVEVVEERRFRRERGRASRENAGLSTRCHWIPLTRWPPGLPPSVARIGHIDWCVGPRHLLAAGDEAAEG